VGTRLSASIEAVTPNQLKKTVGVPPGRFDANE